MHFSSRTHLRLRAIQDILPALLPIFLGDILLVHIYANAFGPHFFFLKLFGYILGQALVTWSVGYFADKWSRKKVLILIHLMTLSVLLISFFAHHLMHYGFIVSSVLFSPGPVCRAALVDNFKSHIVAGSKDNFYAAWGLTEVRLIALSWLAQYTPWILFPLIITLSSFEVLLIFMLLIIVSLFSSIILFKDEVDEGNKHTAKGLALKLKKHPFTFLALLLAQVVFFSFFDKIHDLADPQLLFCLVGVGAFMGTLYSLAYRKTPHISAITNSYTIGLMLSFTSFLYLFSGNATIPIGLQIIQISAIGGSYLPYVYDIIAGRSRAERRSTMFAVAEIVQLAASLVGIVVSAILADKHFMLFAAASLLFFFSIYAH